MYSIEIILIGVIMKIEVIIVKQDSVWLKAQTLQIQVSENILPGLNIGFDGRIPEDVEEVLQAYLNFRG